MIFFERNKEGIQYLLKNSWIRYDPEVVSIIHHYMLNRENKWYWCMVVWQFDFILLIQGTGEWNGLIKQIQDHRADMVLTSLKITPKRSEVVDFSIPFLETGITIMVSIRKGNISPTAFLGLWSSKFSAYPFPILL